MQTVRDIHDYMRQLQLHQALIGDQQRTAPAFRLQQASEITAAACSNQQLGAAKGQDQGQAMEQALITTNQEDSQCGMACPSDWLRSFLRVDPLCCF